MDLAGLYFLSYLLGAVPTAYIFGRLVKGLDIRDYGSGNVGGTNLFRHVGKRWVVPLGLFEVFVKGAAPVWIGKHLLGLDEASGLLIVAPLLAVVGHNWSLFLKFQGGRGIVVASGALLALSPWLLLASLLVSVGGWAATRASGVWVLASLSLLPLLAVLLAVLDMEPIAISWYCGGLWGLTVGKRLLSNWTPFPDHLSKRKVLLNRLLLDRDVANRADWVERVPQRINQEP
jgi:glycerol-3-phosphate acyltransferase PlsY